MAVGQLLGNPLQTQVVLALGKGQITAVQIVIHHLFGGQAKNANVVPSHLLQNLNIRTVQSAQSHRAVKHKLHITSAAGFLAGRGNLLADVGRRIDNLSLGNVEILNENHLNLALADWVVVHQLGHAANQANNLLGKHIARRRLAGKDESVRQNIPLRVVVQLVVKVHNLENIQQLPLVGVNTLYLHVKNRVRVNLNALLLLNKIRQTLLVGQLNLGKTLQKGLVLLVAQQILQLVGVGAPAVANGLVNQLGQKRIGLHQKTPRRNAVGFVVKLIRRQLVKIFHHIVLQNLGVQSGHAVYRMANDNGKVGHTHPVVPKHGGGTQMVMPAGPFQAFAEAAVNLLNNHINPGQQAAHQVNRPSFQSLRQNGVVGVGNGVGGNLPGLVPTQSQIIHQHAHQLRHAQGRVRIVDVDSHPFGHLRPSVVAVALAVTPDNRANASRGKEIFLVQTQSLAGIAGVVRVKHRSQSANFIAVAHCAAVIAPVKGLQIKAFL